MKPKPIYGLLLVGGKSQRMGRDKALLSFDGKTSQLEKIASLLSDVCAKVCVSQRKEQGFPAPADTEIIHDSVEKVKGPLCGILSSMEAYPDADWLVVACDLPNLSKATLEKLIYEYHSKTPTLTAYKSTYDGLPEPLCAIYPSWSGTMLLQLSQELGKSCPRKLLIIKEARLIEQDDPRSLDNINTADEFASATEK